MAQVTESTGKYVRIHIDQRPLESPNPTTGNALYALGQIGPGLELYREVDGDREDVPIPNDASQIHLRQDLHLHSGASSAKTYDIIMNAEQKSVNKRVLDFAEVVALAFPNPPIAPTVVYTVTYKKAAGPSHHGSLLPGGVVEVKNGTIFHVTQTNKS